MTNRINIYGEFNKKMLMQVSQEVVNILKNGNNEKIFLYINSNGGFTQCLFDMLFILEPIKDRLVTVAMENCRSCAALLFLYGKERIIDSSCNFMLHTISHNEENFHANMKELRKIIKDLEVENKRMEEMLVPFSIPKKTWNLIFKEHKNIVLTPDNCIEFNLATEISEIEFSIKQTSPD